MKWIPREEENVMKTGTHANVRFTQETRERHGTFNVEGLKTLSWRKDLKLNAARCCSGTHAAVRFSKATVVTSGSRMQRVLTRAISKWSKTP